MLFLNNSSDVPPDILRIILPLFCHLEYVVS